MRFNTLAVSSALALSLLCGSAVLADVEQAKKYVKEAQDQVDSRSWDDAKSKLELAEAELDGATPADKAAVEASIATVQKQISDANAAGNKAKYTRDLTSVMDDAEGAIGNLVTWKGVEDRANEIFNSADAKAALGDVLVAAQKKFATIKKLNDKKASAAANTEVETAVKDFETFWTETKPKIEKPADPGEKDTAMTDTDHHLDDVRRSLTRVPADSDAGKAFAARVDKIAAEYTQLALADKVVEKAKQLQDAFDSYKDEFAGWDKETAGPTFADYSTISSEDMYALKAPKTEKLITRSNQWIKDREGDDDYKKVQSAPTIKAIVDKVVADRNTALAKMEKFVDAMLTDIEKQPMDQNKIDKVKTFADGMKNNIEGSDKLDAYSKRAQAVVDKFANAGKANDAATAEYYKTMTAAAAKAWPDMKAKFTVTEGFDPNKPADFKGKYIKITTDNLMGFRFNPGDFPFATTLAGIPVAGKYDPTVAAAIKEVQTKMGRSLGDNDDDGKWEIICIVDGTTGKLSKRMNVEGKIKDDAGNEATVTGEKAETVDAAIVTIVAAHCGPLAVAKDAGSVKPDGTITAPGGNSGVSGPGGESMAAMGGGMNSGTGGSGGAGSAGTARSMGAVASLMWLFSIVVGLVAGAVALLKAGFAPLVATAGGVQQKVGEHNLALIGIACAALGVIGLLRGFIIFGLLVNGAVIASGLYAAMDMLEAKGIVKPDLAMKLRPLGVPLGMATVVIVLLSVITRGRLMII